MLALSRDLGTSYKCTFMLAHKLREAMAAEFKGRAVGGEGKEESKLLWRLGHNTARLRYSSAEWSP